MIPPRMIPHVLLEGVSRWSFYMQFWVAPTGTIHILSEEGDELAWEQLCRPSLSRLKSKHRVATVEAAMRMSIRQQLCGNCLRKIGIGPPPVGVER